ncbi:methyl-accepting chemotaxis protein [[Pseudomonas] carboxydohydrogena]|uniref:Methyl-accepting chemotaxis protein n=1 Tax=Afipia carboxydohydrogena TaxID=290 RepID=A0ABY8BQJ9_AFICR|nr:methyl-accepting chemotaxis protein [[Pseudomonas] carboxydohydrogena]WEF51964.1 methyl-accepting chemotaxis protein [[Pseudomonas] carboxydohydrogena]
MVMISLVAAASCVIWSGFGLWSQQKTIDTALERESRADYANLTAALDADTRTTLAVAHTLSVMPQLKALVSADDRDGTIALTQKVLDKIKPLGLELITIQTPPSISFMRAHAPKVFGDDVGARRKMVVEALATKKALGGVEVGREILNVFGSAPMVDGDKVIGNVDIGEPFGDAFVKNMKARFGVDVAIHQIKDDKVKTLASTLSDSGASMDDVKRALNGEVTTHQGEQAGRPVATVFGPINSYSGKPVAVLEIVRDASAYTALKNSAAMWLAMMAIAAMVLGSLISAWIGSSLARPIRALEAAMRAITAGDHDLVVPGAQRADEIGSMAAAVEVFKDSLAETGRLRSAQEQQRAASEAERRETLYALATRFEEGVGHIVSSVSTSAMDLRNTAESMASTAEEATSQTDLVARVSEGVSRSSQAVATAIEEMNASINEIAQQVNESTKVTGDAVAQANNTNAGVRDLAQAAQRIGDVVKLISEIAAQTNLLALNATIEAARAGDAGRGFAVVASEVKELATQTSKATEEIAAQVAAIQSATRTSVDAIDEITQTIGRVNEIASAIASAVEEQGAATREIASNVSQAAEGTSEVSGNIAGVRDAARETGVTAGRVVDAAAALSENGETLKQQVQAFLNEVRAA